MVEETEQEIVKRGYITLGINTGEDNVRYCYALACSIKLCDPNASITLVVDKGQLGNGSTIPIKSPVKLDSLNEINVVDICATETTSAAITGKI